jgi:hypothetical protein
MEKLLNGITLERVTDEIKEEMTQYRDNLLSYREEKREEFLMKVQILQKCSSMFGENMPSGVSEFFGQLCSAEPTDKEISSRAIALEKLGIKKQKCDEMARHKDLFLEVEIAMIHACCSNEDIVPFYAQKVYSSINQSGMPTQVEQFGPFTAISSDPKFSKFKESVVSYLLKNLTA